MPKGFLIKRHEEMSGVEALYRPWSEAPHQEEPVDFSLRNPREDVPEQTILDDSTGCSQEIIRVRRNSETGNRIFVRTPDSGFSSPSDSETYRRSVIFPSVRQYLSHISESLHIDTEQTAPLALIKKREAENHLYPSPSESNQDNYSFTPKSDDPRYLLSPPIPQPFPLLSPSVYWPHGSSPLRSPIPFTSPLGRTYDLGFQTVPNLTSPQEGLNLTSRAPTLTTPTKQPCKSPGSSTTPSKRKSPVNSLTPEKKTKSHKKTKASRRLNFDDEKTSPVSGTIIRELVEGEEPLVVRKGDIDPAYNVVEITEEAKSELAKIDNKIGDYVCRLCKELYDDAFGLAQHRCSRIIHVEYRCPECDKVFNCPANLASHRRWHKPKGTASTSSSGSNKSSRNLGESSTSGGSTESSIDNSVASSSSSNPGQTRSPPPLVPLSMAKEDIDEDLQCHICNRRFKRQTLLRKHLATHCPPEDHLPSQYPTERPLQQHPPPLTPLLSPGYPGEMVGCNMCSAAFFTSAALQLHVATAHGQGEGGASSSILVPRPQYSPRASHMIPQPPPHPPHMPPPLSAPS